MFFYKKSQTNEKLEEIFSKKNFNEDIKNYLRSLDIENRRIALKTIFRNPEVDSASLIELINKEINKENNKKLVLKEIANKNKIDLLIDKYVDQKEKIKSLPRKYQEWLANRFGENNKIFEAHSLEDCIPILINYNNKEASIISRFQNEIEFKEKLILEMGKNINYAIFNINSLSSDNMFKIMEIYSSKKALEITPKNLEGDFVGKVGEWNIWLPSCRENSIAIVGYDKLSDGTLQPKTTWCTARIYNSNLFYNYIGGSRGKFLLFYIIRDNPKKLKEDDYLSMGIMDGKPFFSSQDGGASVDALNRGLTEDRFKSILGGNFEEILNLIKAKSKSLGGISPAYSKIEEAAQDVNVFNKLIEKNNKEEKEAIYEAIINLKNINGEVLRIISKSSNDIIRGNVAININTPPDVLKQLCKDDSESVVIRALSNENTPKESLLECYNNLNHDDEYVSNVIKTEIAKNINTPINIILELYNDKNHTIRSEIAKNINTPPNVLAILSKDSHYLVVNGVAENINAPADILREIYINNKEKNIIKQSLAGNINAPADILMELSNEKNKIIKRILIFNKNTPISILNNFAMDGSDEEISELAKKAILKRNANNKFNNLIKLCQLYYKYSIYKN